MKYNNTVPVLLVVPPLYSCEIPSIACSLLKASLWLKGIKSKVFYSNLSFAHMIGLKQFQTIFQYTDDTFLRERLFLTSACDNVSRVVIKERNGMPNVPKHLIEFYGLFNQTNKKPITQTDFDNIEALCKRFISEIVWKLVPLQPQIIGFSNNIMQINSCTALARVLKNVLPHSIFVVGGSNCSGVMGEEIAASTEIFDYVFQGEADWEFADFCNRYLKTGYRPIGKLVKCVPPSNLDALPTPDYTDYFEQNVLEGLRLAFLPFESSRGCWWGQKNPCRFCGMNANRIDHRYKHPDRVIEELESLETKYSNTPIFFAMDTICPRSYFADLFPRIAERKFGGKLAYEVKSNLSYPQLAAMKRAGIDYINPGIEALSTRLLRLMRKGGKAVTNIRLLRDCRELNIKTFWNCLIGIPGDQTQDYDGQCRFIPFLEHLAPPAIIPITIQRFSPYFEDHLKYKVIEIQPSLDYEGVFSPNMDISRIAFFFEAQFPSESREKPGMLTAFIELLAEWVKRWCSNSPPVLDVEGNDEGFWCVMDTRTCAEEGRTILSQEEYALLQQCRLPKIHDQVETSPTLNNMLKRGYLIEVDDRLLSIVCERKPEGKYWRHGNTFKKRRQSVIA